MKLLALPKGSIRYIKFYIFLKVNSGFTHMLVPSMDGHASLVPCVIHELLVGSALCTIAINPHGFHQRKGNCEFLEGISRHYTF